MKSAIKKNRHLWTLVASAALLLVLLAQPSPAVADTWVGPKPNTLWSNPNNWSLGSPPGAGDTVNLTSTSNKTAYYDTTSNPSLLQLFVDASGGSTFTLSQPGNALSVQFGEFIGTSGKGQVVQTGGTNTNNSILLGGNSGSSGTYTLSGGGSLSSDVQTIGESGTGLFNQTGGNNTVNFTLALGIQSTGVGTYNLSGGHLQADNEIISSKGTGTFNQSGGNNNISTTLTLGNSLGNSLGGVGTYNLSGGNLTANNEYIGQNGTGTFTQNATSTNIINDTLSLGFSSNGSGTYTMKGGYLQTDQEFIGDNGTGTFIQKGGTHLVSNELIVGNNNTANGAFNLLGGSLSAGNEFISNPGTAQFTQSGGTNTISTQLTVGLSPGSNGTYTLNGGTNTTPQLTVGDAPGSSGTYTLNAGQLNVTNATSTATEFIGNGGTGGFTQSGGTNTTNNLTLGDTATGNGTYNLVKGNLNVTGNEIIGNNGTGTFTQIGGTHTADFLYVGDGTGSTGTFNLQGGTLSVTHFILMRDGTFNVKNTTTTVTTGLVDNRKVVTTTNANVTWNSEVENSGAYISQNSTQTFNFFLQVAHSGYLVGASQDLFVIKGDFINQSTNGAQWNTVLSTLQFVTGADNSHDLYIPGVVNPVNERVPPPNNFSWATLNITGQTIDLLDGNELNPTTALYVGKILGVTLNSSHQVTNIVGSSNPADPIFIYFDPALNPTLGMNDYAFASGYGALKWDPPAEAPLPPSVLLLGSGLLGLGALGWRRKRG